MMRLMTACALLASAGCTTAQLAMENPTLAAAGVMQDAAANMANERTERNVASLQAQNAAALAAAARPGDDQLTCEQLQTEAYAYADNQALAANEQALTAAAKAQVRTAATMAAVNTTATVAGGFATAGSPVARDAFILGQSASILAQTAATAGADKQAMAAASSQISAYGRLQLVYQLAGAKNCAFMQVGRQAGDQIDDN